MTTLVADIGGTNSRLALADDTGRLLQQDRFGNDRFPSFPDLLRHYLRSRDLPDVNAACIAIAGPVAGDHARLTNRDWAFDADDIAAAFSSPLSGRVRLINDLAALGYAIGALPPASLRDIRAPAADAGGNDQALVAGLGTGFNVCAVKGGPVPTVFEAEMGYASLPASVTTALQAALGDAAAPFRRNEDLFCGRGLARLDSAVTGRPPRPGPEIVSRAQMGEADALRTLELAARLLGLMASNLVPTYMPLAGLYLAGSVARAVLNIAEPAFLESYSAPGPFSSMTARVPVRLITDDAAALIGASRAAGR